jgi:hemerythrin
MFLTNLRADTSSGVPAMDELHRLCGAAIDHASTCDDEVLERVFGSMLQQLQHAFAIEDGWMESIDYAAIKSHREQHSRVLGALHHVHAEVMGGNHALGRRVAIDLLPKWLAVHIETMDAVLAVVLHFDDRDATPALPGHVLVPA